MSGGYETPNTDRWAKVKASVDANRPLRVLVCDDERAIVRLIQVNLERQGFSVIAAFDGKEALDKVLQESPDLCVLDIIMPYVDGMEVLRRIRKNPQTSEIPVILLTTEVHEAKVEEGYRLGADLYMTKPFNPSDLANVLLSLNG
jgi:DNA-binding response OmpR family regulator